MMMAFEKIAGVAKDLVNRASTAAFGDVSIRVYLSNSTETTISILGQPHRQGNVELSFSSLGPGEAGMICAQGSSQIGFALELKVGEEALLLGASGGSLWNGRLKCEFDKPGARVPGCFFGVLPGELMGSGGARSLAEGERYAVYASPAEQGSHVTVHLLLGPKAVLSEFKEPDAGLEMKSRNCLAPGFVNSEQLLEFAEWRQEEKGEVHDLAKAVFLMEYSSVLVGLRGLRPHDRAFGLDMLIAGLIAAGTLDEQGKVVKAELQKWRDQQQELFGEANASNAGSALPVPPGTPAQGQRLPQYREYERKAKANANAFEAHTSTSLLLIQAAALEAASTMRAMLKGFTGSAPDEVAEPQEESSFSFSPAARRKSSAEDIKESNCAFMMDHLAAEDEDTAVAAFSEDDEANVVAAAQQCIQDSAGFARRRGRVLAALEGRLRGEQQAALRHYIRWSPASRQRFSPEHRASGEVVGFYHESWCPELMGAVDGGRETSPEQLLRSLGKSSPKYKTMSTNSKSGEFFFFSSDRKFILKTVSKPEAELLFSMLPAYQAHLADLPRSLLVRFAGLFRADIPRLGEKYFIVMASVFDSAHKVHETYDVKGSTLNRKAKEGESCKKDEDWVGAGKRLHLSPNIRSEVRELHEQDAAFLASFEVMDYSLLIGVHRLDPGAAGAEGAEVPGDGWRSPVGLWSATEPKELYFVGLIDFLIGFSLKKQAEHVLRAAQGHGHDASCVDPKAYATRQVRFVSGSVLPPLTPSSASTGRKPRCPYGAECVRNNAAHKEEECHPGSADWEADEADAAAAGSVGLLRVTFIKGVDLINTDFGMDVSDPYGVAGLGLQRLQTQTINNNLNPVWNCELRVAVDRAHLDQDLELSVWDEDHNRHVQGSDDFLGRLTFPVAKIMNAGSLLVKAKLKDVSKGELHARIDFLPLSALPIKQR